MSTEPAALLPQYKDRKTGLVVFGVFEIVLGGFVLLGLAMTLLSQMLLRHRPEMAGQMDVRSLLPTWVMMGGLSATLVWLGIGSIQARRWARALSLCLGWVGLTSGLVGCAVVLGTLSSMDVVMQQSAANAGQSVPTAMLTIMKCVTLAFVVTIYVIVPGALVLFYCSRNVKLTCEARDPVVRWTDRCPLPVLAIVLIQFVGAISLVGMLPAYGRAFPFFGFIIKGAAAYALYVGFAVVSLYLARGFYRLERRAWWIYVAILVAWGTNSIVAFSGGRLMIFYEAIGLPEAQLRQMKALPFLQSSGFVWGGAVCLLLAVGYLGWIKRYFDEGESVGVRS